MARFVQHEPCPGCGSRDNLGRYDDGSAHCFGGCGYFERPTHAPRRAYEPRDIDEDSRGYPKMPEDAGHDFPEEAVTWLAQYGIGIPEAIKRGLLWSNYRRQLIFDMENLWQARNFDPEQAKKRKYFTAGDVNDHLPIYGMDESIGNMAIRVNGGDLLGGSDGGTNRNPSRNGVLVLVEDCVSALKIARQCDAMPVLGSHLSPSKLTRLARLYSSLIVWLDSDKLKESMALATKAGYLGLSTNVIFTEADPKCYSDFMIANYLRIKK